VAYYCWIWQCYLSLGRWPYDFLDLREPFGNKIYAGIAVIMYVVVFIQHSSCRWQEKFWNTREEQKQK